MQIRKAVILAAGLGTRFLPVTKAQPKEMLPIVDKPTLQIVVEEAVASGIEDILIVTGRNKSAIENHFDRTVELELELEKKGKMQELQEIREISEMANIYYIRQKELLGSGHAVYRAKGFVGNEPFAVMVGDDIVYHTKPVLKQMIEIYDEVQTSVLGVQQVSRTDVSKYGIIDGVMIRDRVYRVKSLVEKPPIDEAPSDIAALGRYIINPSIFDILEYTKPGTGGEIQLTDALKMQAQQEEMYAYYFAGRRYDVGDKQGFLQATVEYALRREDLRDQFLQFLLDVVSSETN